VWCDWPLRVRDLQDYDVVAARALGFDDSLPRLLTPVRVPLAAASSTRCAFPAVRSGGRTNESRRLLVAHADHPANAQRHDGRRGEPSCDT
jgi:hypothetical protein